MREARPQVGDLTMEKSLEARLVAYEKALQMAIGPQMSTEEIVDRAKVFAGFLTGPLESHEPQPEKVMGFRHG